METRVIVRDAGVEDFDGFSRLFPELGLSDAPPSLERWVREMMPWTFIAERGGVTVGYAWWRATGPVGHVRHVVTAPGERRRGIGRRLMSEIARAMRERGCGSWRINVRPENTAAIRLYESAGFERAYASCSMRFPWTLVESLPTEDSPVRCMEIGPRDDAAVEAAFDWLAGILAEARCNSGRVLRRLSAAPSGDEILGACVFDPAFPGAYPFCVVRPTLARPLLEELRPYALDGMEEMQIVVEGDEALAQLLKAHGASTALVFDHYRGAIPPI